MTEKRDTSGARHKDLSEPHLGQIKAEEERESEEKLRHMGKTGQKAEPDKKKREVCK